MKTTVKIVNNSYKWVEVEGTVIENFWQGYAVMLHRKLDNKHMWTVSDRNSGRLITSATTQKDAKQKAFDKLEYHGLERYLEVVNKSKERQKEHDSRAKQARFELHDYDRYSSHKPITSDLVLDMAKIHTITVKNFIKVGV